MKQKLKLMVWFLLVLGFSTAFAIDEDELLDPEVAFRFEVTGTSADRIDFKWNVAEGYYLYKGRMSFKTENSNVVLDKANLPMGKRKVDEFFGEVETYNHSFEGSLGFTAAAGARFDLKVTAQGCAEAGVCYPPQTLVVPVVVPGAAIPQSVIGLSVPPVGDLFGSDLLPEEQAFVYEAIADSGNRVLVRFTMPDAYYLYRDKTRFKVVSPAGISVQGVDLPEGEMKNDPEFGNVAVFHGQIEVPVTLSRTLSDAVSISLEASFQGCKENAVCYPPMVRALTVDLPEFDSSTTVAAVSEPQEQQSEQDQFATALASDSKLAALALFFVAGLLLAFTPCVFPMLPILSGIIAGQGENVTVRKGFLLSLAYVLAMALTYTVAGILAGVFGQNLQAAFQNPWILSIFAGVFVLLSLSMFGFYELQLPSSWQTRFSNVSNRQQGGTYIGAAIMGLLSALIVGPCVAPPLMGALIYIGQEQDPVLGGMALFIMAMGMGVPLLVVGASAGKFLPKAGMWMNSVKAVFGVMMLGMALWMLERILPGAVMMLLWGILMVVCAIYLRAMDSLPDDASGWRRLWKGVGVILLLVGVLEIYGGLSGGDDYMQPVSLQRIAVGQQGVQSHEVEFDLVKTLGQVEKIVEDASSKGQYVMLDFYADWCVECKRMEKTTFSQQSVVDALSGVILLKVDVTKNDDIDKELLRHYGLIGPPATIFYDESGDEIKKSRLIGYKNEQDFIDHVQAAIQ